MIIKVNGIERKLGLRPTGPEYERLKERPVGLFQRAKQALTLPRSSDLRQWASPVKDQGAEGACAPFAKVGISEWFQNYLGLPFVPLSEQYLYRLARIREHTWPQDVGSTITSNVIMMYQKGDCPESDWPYVAGEYDKNPPSPQCDLDAPKHKVTAYYKFNPYTGINQALTILTKKPFIAGIAICDNFPGISSNGIVTPDDHTGIVPMPSNGCVLGWHGIGIYGFSKDSKTYDNKVTVPFPHLIFKNSWGVIWGYDGWGFLPLDYMKLCPTNGGQFKLMCEFIEIVMERDIP